MMRWWITVLAALLAGSGASLLISQSRSAAAAKEEQLWHHRNRGKAFYENPAMQTQAVEEFRKALALAPGSARERLNYGLALLRAGRTPEAVAELRKVQAQQPDLPHTWFNLGIVHKRAGEVEQALAMFERMVALVPDDAVSHYNLGVLYKLQNRTAQSLDQFERAKQLAPSLAAPHFQLYNGYRLAGRREEAARELALFQQMKKAQEDSGITEDMEWNEYAEVFDPIDPSAGGAEALPAAALRFTARVLDAAFAAHEALVFDYDADGKPDLLAWGDKGVKLFRAGSQAASSALPPGRHYTVSDVDNDGFPDLCVLMANSADLFHNRKGKFVKAAKPLASGTFTQALWLDYDHDYDQDLLLFGEIPVLLRNQGEAGFVDRTPDFPFAQQAPIRVAAIRVMADTKGVDVIASHGERGSYLYRDRLAGKYERVHLEKLSLERFQVRDWNHDGYPDVAADGPRLIANRRGIWTEQSRRPESLAGIGFADLSNHGITEIVSGGSVYTLSGDKPRKADGLEAGSVLAVADFNGDGREDVVTANGARLILNENTTDPKNRWFAVKLDGVKNLKLAPGAEVEVRAGSLYQKKIYQGYPLVFGLRGYGVIDTVRITWPNGLIQNEPKQPAGRLTAYKEAQRLSGSCPMIFTWDGGKFRFLTDVLGVAPLGASAGEGEYFPTDHDEYVWIPGEVLREKDGFLELRITEELGEVTYLDQLKLIAVDHAADVEVFSNDKWKSPPFPESRLYETKKRLPPVRAFDHRGRDVLSKVIKLDRRYADTFERTMINTAEMHALELDFGPGAPDEDVFLVLNGWVDWADGSAFLKTSQEPGRVLIPPYLQVRDKAGAWRTVIADMGIPSGKTKTIAVDLSDKFLSESREVRIVTNLCVFWDEVSLAVREPPSTARLGDLHLGTAELGFHGFSKAVIHPERRQPEIFLYEPVSSISAWNPTPGMYTRFGDVKDLLAEADDRFVIMGSGDEIKVRFRAAAPVSAGWKRDYLLYVNGWAKDSDANTAHSQTVEPLPFHGMSRYPYSPPERFPDDALHNEYRRQYNTRPALRLLRPIAP